MLRYSKCVVMAPQLLENFITHAKYAATPQLRPQNKYSETCL